MTAREALLRIALDGIRAGHCKDVDPKHVERFLQQLEADSPHLLTEEKDSSPSVFIQPTTGRNIGRAGLNDQLHKSQS